MIKFNETLRGDQVSRVAGSVGRHDLPGVAEGHRQEGLPSEIGADQGGHAQETSAKAVKMTAVAIVLIEERIALDLSPGQVVGWWEAEQGVLTSHERLHQHIGADQRHGGALCRHLRQSNKKRKKQYASKDKRGQVRTVSALTNVLSLLPKNHALAQPAS